MPIKNIEGDILELYADAIAVPHFAHDDIYPEITQEIISTAGFKLMNEYNVLKGNASPKIKPGEAPPIPHDHPLVTRTLGYDLKAEYAIHVCVEAYDPSWSDSEASYVLERCYECVLDAAFSLKGKIKKIAFPLLGIGNMNYPLIIAAGAASRSVTRWLSKHKPDPEDYDYIPEVQTDILIGYYDPFTVYTVTPPSALRRQVNADRSCGKTTAYPAVEPDWHSCFSEYEERLAKARYGKKLTYDRNALYGYFMNYNKSDNYLAELTGYTNVTRFKNGKIKHPSKQHTVAMAVGMELGDYERFEFIRCAGHKYPSEERDLLVEEIIRSGTKGFTKINAKLMEKSPGYALNMKISELDQYDASDKTVSK